MSISYVDSFDLFGVKARQKACLTGQNPPTATTEGAVGDLYMCSSMVYKCIAVKNGEYLWEPINEHRSLVVDLIDRDAVNSSADEIYGSVKAGMNVVLNLGDRFLNISSCNDTCAIFLEPNDDNTVILHIIDDNGEYVVQDLQVGGDGGGSSGGTNLMIVTAPNGEYSDHFPSEIYAHVKAGGTAMFHDDGAYLTLSYCTDTYATFSTISDDYVHWMVSIDDDGACHEYELPHADSTTVWEIQESIGDISSALDRIIELQEELIGV